MTLRDNALLFDITTRLALFVEGVKLGQMQEFNSVLASVDEELRRLFGKVEHKTLDGLSKAELNRLLLSLRKVQLRVYSAYTQKLLKALEDFMQLRLEMTAVAYASVKLSFLQPDEDFTQLSEDAAFDFIATQSEKETFAPLFGLAVILPTGKPSLWSTVKNAPIPANGLNLLPFVNTFARSAQASIENTIRKAYANRQTVAETLAELNGKRSTQGNSTVFAKLGRQANAVIDAAYSHVDQIVSQAVISAIFASYQWVSIIDDSTTHVCQEREGKTYRYGSGPIPPAHYGCRSVTVPLASLFDDFKPLTLYAWLKRQPRAVQEQFIGKEAAALLDTGKITAKDFAGLTIAKPLSLTQFKSKLELILTA